MVLRTLAVTLIALTLFSAGCDPQGSELEGLTEDTLGDASDATAEPETGHPVQMGVRNAADESVFIWLDFPQGEPLTLVAEGEPLNTSPSSCFSCAEVCAGSCSDGGGFLVELPAGERATFEFWLERWAFVDNTLCPERASTCEAGLALEPGTYSGSLRWGTRDFVDGEGPCGRPRYVRGDGTRYGLTVWSSPGCLGEGGPQRVSLTEVVVAEGEPVVLDVVLDLQ